MAITAAKKPPNPTDRHIGSRVRMRRKMLAMSQTQLADALGITYRLCRQFRRLKANRSVHAN
jgi:transcriptional regulator with XRE-family HTH domain